MSFQSPATPVAATPGFSFGLTASTPVGAAGAPNAAVPPTTKSSFSFGATGGGDAGGMKPPAFGVPKTTAAAMPIPASTAAPLSFAAPKPSTALGATTVSAPTPASGGFANLTSATKTTDSSAVANAPQLSYNQLEEHINKWTLELEEQEKVFVEQATQINAWDKILIANNQKILELNDAVQKVKSDQQTLEQELEFISTQHKELEESIVPLQKEFMKIPQVDVERSQTYLLVENLDTQLKQMSEDLKEIIDNLNESNKGQDTSDPIIQIGKILSSHMSSLQWIESSTSSICHKLEDVSKLHESIKRDSERSFRSAYYS